jgi:hypothetical protein
MSAETRRFTGNDKQIVKTRVDTILELPDGEFAKQDLEPALAKAIKDLRDKNIIVPCGTREQIVTEDDGEADWSTRYEVNIYRVVPHALEIAKEVVAQRDAWLPCGHSGLRRVDDSYQCCCFICDQEYDRHEVKVDG